MLTPRKAHTEGSVYFYTAKGARFPQHHHSSLELNLCIAGTAAYLVSGGKIPIESRHLLWLYPGQDHLLVDVSSNFEIWVVEFDASLLSRILSTPQTSMLGKAQGWQSSRLSRADFERLDELYRQLYTQKDPGIFNSLLSGALAQSWILHQGGKRLELSKLHSAVRIAVEKIIDGDEDDSLPRLAELAALSSSRLSRLFKAQVGLGIAEFRSRQRLERFLELFDNGQRCSLSEAAYQAGFGSYTQFHRVFSEQYGESPREYAEQLKQKSNT